MHVGQPTELRYAKCRCLLEVSLLEGEGVIIVTGRKRREGSCGARVKNVSKLH